MEQNFDLKDLLADLEIPDDKEQTPDGKQGADSNIPVNAEAIPGSENWVRFEKTNTLFAEGQNLFQNPNFLQDCIKGEEIGLALRDTIKKLLHTENAEDRTRLRGLLIGQYWQLLESVAGRVGSAELTPSKKLFIRFAMFSPNLISEEQRALLSRVRMSPAPDTHESLHYLDEWFTEIARGNINPSLLSEINTESLSQKRKKIQNTQQSKLQEQVDSQMIQIKGQNDRIKNLLGVIQNRILAISSRDVDPIAEGEQGPFNEQQRRCISEIPGLLRDISVSNRTLKNNLSELHTAKKRLMSMETIEDSVEDAPVLVPKLAKQEATTMRQMAKLCIGRSGNHFPVLFKSHFLAMENNIGTRENVNNIIARVEYLDPSIFLRSFRNVTRHIVPHIVLIPCYGNAGICWEAFEKQNRASSRGRVVIPMFPRNLEIAVTSAMGDLRWQQVKEAASRFWMEEGLTGWYYDYYVKEKLKGDIKEHFIRDYVTWITKESLGTQLLNKEVRDIFWRYLPFPQELKEKLKNQGFVYQQLYRKDLNRTMSSMY